MRAKQAGFRRGRGTTEQIFILRNIVELSIEWNATTYVNFIDFEKAFDSVHQDSLWKIMKYYGIPAKIINMVKLFYKKSECTVLDNGKESAWFQVKTGVKQGCNMSEFLFLLVIDWIMKHSLQGNTGIRWQMMTKLKDLDFADDLALISSSQKTHTGEDIKPQQHCKKSRPSNKQEENQATKDKCEESATNHLRRRRN